MTLKTMADVLAGADDSPALLVGSGGAAYTRGALRRLAAQFAATLRASGIKPGDVVTIAEPNTVSSRGMVLPALVTGPGKPALTCQMALRLAHHHPTLCRLPLYSIIEGRVCGGVHWHHPGSCHRRATEPKLQDGELAGVLLAGRLRSEEWQAGSCTVVVALCVSPLPCMPSNHQGLCC